ncbi:hypothetical protein PVAP13_1KG402305 [Panicum virgatum]|uniref:Pentatricopeptide repeat-containing protein n=1 Tax=Panicum virgatum TaxID=38727 RepID=A0A8T0XPB6_PANVG|nr:hypothetical protein PVAP13_1KG402305 [Panicum virgatum]
MGSGILNTRPFSWLAAVAAAKPTSFPSVPAVLLTSGHLSSHTSVNSLLRAAPSPSACAPLLRLLLLHRLLPDHISLSFSLHSCTRVPSHPITSLLHSLAVRLGHSRDVYVVNAAVSSYFTASDVASADWLFSEISNDVADVVTWTTMVNGHASAGSLGRARSFFDAMPERNVVSWNAMLGAYARAGLLPEARKLFDAMPDRNAATWSCMLNGLVHSGYCEEALRVFNDMVSSGVVPNEAALVSAVSVCTAAVSGAWCMGACLCRTGAARGHEHHPCHRDHRHVWKMWEHLQCCKGVRCNAREKRILLELNDCWACNERRREAGLVALMEDADGWCSTEPHNFYWIAECLQPLGPRQ